MRSQFRGVVVAVGICMHFRLAAAHLARPYTRNAPHGATERVCLANMLPPQQGPAQNQRTQTIECKQTTMQQRQTQWPRRLKCIRAVGKRCTLLWPWRGKKCAANANWRRGSKTRESAAINIIWRTLNYTEADCPAREAEPRQGGEAGTMPNLAINNVTY